jgi:hypothetical protein
LDEAPCLARFGTFLDRSSEFSIFSGWVLGLLGVVFTSLLDFYRASRSCHEVLNELITEVLLSTLKPCINTNSKTGRYLIKLIPQVLTCSQIQMDLRNFEIKNKMKKS